MSLPVGTATSILSMLKTLTVSLLSLYNQLSTWLADSKLVEQQTGAYGSSRQVIFSTWKCTARGVSVADASYGRQLNLSQNWLLVEHPLKILRGKKNCQISSPGDIYIDKASNCFTFIPSSWQDHWSHEFNEQFLCRQWNWNFVDCSIQQAQ